DDAVVAEFDQPVDLPPHLGLVEIDPRGRIAAEAAVLEAATGELEVAEVRHHSTMRRRAFLRRRSRSMTASGSGGAGRGGRWPGRLGATASGGLPVATRRRPAG